MTTTNIVSTPNINGNIGSCEVKATKEQIGNSFWTSEYQTVFVNSCSGEVITKNQFTSYDGVWLVLVIFVVFMFSFFAFILNN